ncbi:hypothetical protein QYM36_012914 [Artemia franciscana]|uniref:Uncharacterized protein n=1 Tax=Artemia franciscana TaxID=6661 RepID=A0AA88HK47_ARTSF|nr:hypothetical protein QYM36_012914 [Artemia franciscana]
MDVESEKEKERGYRIMRMLLDITTTLELVQRIVAEGNEAHLFRVFADGTPTVSHEERLAVGVRYDDVEGAAKECLLTVVYSESKKGVDLFRRNCASNEEAWYQ